MGGAVTGTCNLGPSSTQVVHRLETGYLQLASEVRQCRGTEPVTCGFSASSGLAEFKGVAGHPAGVTKNRMVRGDKLASVL